MGIKKCYYRQSCSLRSKCAITDSDAHTEDSRAGKDAPVVIEDNV